MRTGSWSAISTRQRYNLQAALGSTWRSCQTEGVTVSLLHSGNHVVAKVQVEFYGIPRARAGVAMVSATANTLGDLVLSLSNLFPALGESCFEGPHFRQGYTANVCGDRFTTDPVTPISDGDTVLILSLDAGG